MLDRSEAESLLYRVASAALSYYPDKPTLEPGYTIDEDIDWCLRPLSHLPAHHLQTLRARIADIITDPTAQRQAFVRDVNALITH